MGRSKNNLFRSPSSPKNWTNNNWVHNLGRTQIVGSDHREPSSYPIGFREVIMQWLDENLSPVVKRGVNFRKAAHDTTSYSLNSDVMATGERRYINMYVSFNSDGILVSCMNPPMDTKIEYANPEMFEILKRCFVRFYNGV